MLCIHYFHYFIKRKKLFGRPNIKYKNTIIHKIFCLDYIFPKYLLAYWREIRSFANSKKVVLFHLLFRSI